MSDLQDTFAGLSWDAPRPERSEILRQLTFLGNVDASAPETWPATSAWARELAEDVTNYPHAIYALDQSAVLIQRLENGNVSCLFVSDEVISDQFQDEFPDLALRRFGKRQFGWFDQTKLKVSAAFLDQSANELAAFADGRLSSATIPDKSASAKED